MKITLDKDTLTEKLSLASKFTSARLVSSTVLQGVLIEGADNGIILSATNLNAYFQTHIKTEQKEVFRVVVEPKKIIEFLQFLASGSLELEIVGPEVVISQGKTRGVFPVIVSEDFPPFPQVEGKEVALDRDFFQEKLPLVLFSASVDDSRPALTGVYLTRTDEGALLVSTDGFRLSLMKLKDPIELPPIIIPADFLTTVSRTVKSEKKISVSYSEKEQVVRFRTDAGDFVTRLIDGEFPPYERILQSEHETRVLLDREEFLRAIRLISVFARDYSHIVVCEFTKEGVRVRPKKEARGENKTFIDAECKGPDQTVAFNYKFLLDFVNSVKSKKITIDLLRADAPATFRLGDSEDYLHVIMPVRLQE